MSEQILREIEELFPTIGMVVPEIEIKFRLAGKYGQDVLNTTLEDLVGKGILSRFEFNNIPHYKCKTDFPVGGKAAQTTATVPTQTSNGNQLDDLAAIVIALAKSTNNDEINKLVENYVKNHQK